MSFDKYKIKGAYHYKWYESGEPASYKKCVDRCVKFCKGSTLDIGCGDGLLAQKIFEEGYGVTGIDSDPTGIQLARENNPLCKFIHNNLNSWLPQDAWSYAVCLNVIEHLNPEDAWVIKDIFKACIGNAMIIITDMPQDYPSSSHVKEYSPKELADLFKDYKVVPFQIDKDFHGIEVYK